MNQLRDNLKTLGLSPNHIFQQVKDAISEDLAGGEDITSISTISETQVSTAEFTSRSAGVVSGLHVVAAVLEYCGINHYEVLVFNLIVIIFIVYGIRLEVGNEGCFHLYLALTWV